jgi:TonB dependent receptor/Carboxypeptidase regulatory-like domain
MALRTLALRVMCVGLALVLPALPAASQTRSTLTGKVTDQTSATLPGVTVTLESLNLVGGPQTSITNDEGKYRFSDLLPGTYHLTFSLQGFRATNRKGIRLAFGTTLTVDVALSVAALEESVLVTDAGPVIDVTTAASTVKIEQERLQNLPLTNKRQGFEVLHLAPGIGSRSAYGSPRDANQLLVDGVPITTAQFAGTAPAAFNVNWMEEVQVVTLGANAEYGEFTGAASNMLMRSGSNAYSGLLEYVTTRPGWVSDNRGSLSPALRASFRPQEVLTYWDSSAQLGGPLKRDHLFFFVGAQYFRNKVRQAGSLGDLPNDERWPRGTAKLNWAISPNVRLEGFILQHRIETEGLKASLTNLPEATTIQTGRTIQWSGRFSWTPNKATLVEVRNGILDFDQHVVPRGPGTCEGPASRIDRLTGIRSVNTDLCSNEDSTRNLTSGSVTYYLDRFFGSSHALKIGVEYERTHSARGESFPEDMSFTDFNGMPEQVVLWEGLNVTADGNRTTLYAQDTWTLNDRLTFLPGVRVSFNRGSVPDRGGVFETDPVSPRIGVAWDLLGNRRTVVRAHYGRFHEGFFTSLYEFLDTSGLNPRITARVLGPGNFQELSRTASPTNFGIDSGIRHAYVDQYVVGLERELMPDLAVTAQYIRRQNDDIFAFIDTGSRYEPRQLRDPGPDGLAGSADDGDLVTVFNLLNPGEAFLLLTNPDDAFRRYHGVQFIGKKRYAQNWQLFAAYTWSRTQGTVNNAQRENVATGPDTGQTGSYQNPNQKINVHGRGVFDFTHEGKLEGTYRLPFWGGVNVSANYVYRSGTAWGRTAVFRLPTQGNQTVRIEPRGTRRSLALSQVDLRAEKTFPLGASRVVGMYVDVFNVNNQGIPSGFPANREPSGATFGTPTAWLAPRTVQVGARLTF